MSRRSIEGGTLALPWPSSSQRSRRRIETDASVLVATVVLALVGLIMVFSASAVLAGNRFHDSIYFLKRQVVWLAFGFLLLHMASRVDYTLWRRLAWPILGLTVVLLILVLVPSLGVAAKGARRWLRLGLFSMQPAELAKLGVVLYMASYLTKKGGRVTEWSSGLLPPLIVVGLLGGLLVLQPDLGTAVVIGFVAFGLLFLGGARLTHLFGMILVAVPVMAMLVLGSSYRRQRFLTFLAPWKDPTDAGFQVTQSFLAFGSGGLFGVGLGEGKQKLFFLPEAHTDFVLALVGEELGLVGTGGIIVLFVILVIKGFQIAGRAREPFGRYLALGISLLIGLQALINAGVVTGLLPTKGLTLPLVSYGGSSMIVNLFAIGILLSVSRDRQGGKQAGLYGIGRGGRVFA
ncbi:MAG: putative lipid II flippase FtsW [Nitrospirae bacterium]|nr:MAG: putative lipid II flippase FtsW [Nitrospirota bacterium]